MATEAAKVVRRVFEAAACGDTGAVLDLYDRSVEWDASRTTRGAMTGRVARGRREVLEWLREWYDAWETVDDELQELVEVDDSTVVTVMIQRGRGRASGVELENLLGTIWTVREGRVMSAVWYPTGEAAFEAAGISRG